ncbi:MAG TPA: hypothetical protein VH395_13865, partial [Jatrophihabitantaceae bacterium]
MANRMTLGRTARLGTIAAGVVAGALVLSACGSSGGGSGSTPAAGGGGSTGGGGSSGKAVGVSLILKTLSNPYFVSMEKDAKAQAAKDNVK